MFAARGTRKSRCPALNVTAFADHCETMGNREQFAAGFDPVRIETAGEKLPHRRYEGGAAGQEHLVDCIRCDLRLFQNLVQCALDLGKVLGDPVVEIATLDRLATGPTERRELNSASSDEDSAILVAEID